MASLEIPTYLKQLLEDSRLHAPIRTFSDRVGEILADNKLAFFPDYTDHGIDHIERVLRSETELVPDDIWKNIQKHSSSPLLCDADGAVIIGATLLHDIAMHLRPHGLLELVGKDSRFQPLPWFRENQEGHSADRPWHDLWDDYVREARRFSERDLTNIIGEKSARNWKFDGLPDDVGKWETNHNLVIGEFVRRHHARLAHEIAIYGFPGLAVGSGRGQFPALGTEHGHSLKELADLIGLAARSHGTSLRVCKEYLDSTPGYRGMPRPMGTAVLYPMALLRVADYLQIDRNRAPAVLLQLRNPQSPVSVREWEKHLAVQYVGPADDPRGTMVTVSRDLSLSLYLQLRDLLVGLQAEMDHSTAVLDEAYGNLTRLGLDRLNLATRRVHSNLHQAGFLKGLPYVPAHTGFTADPNLLTLLVEPLYGKQPSVGVRELMQNAADAVVELEAWCRTRGMLVESLDLFEQDGDVLIEFIKRDDGSWYLRVRDRGIGMTADTIQNYFLRAGASFRRSAEWAKEFVDEDGKARVLRSGRFGIGVFAVFLLGPSFRLWTRHAGANKSDGYMIEASASSQLIEVKLKGGLQVGTTIEVEISKEALVALDLELEGGAGPAKQTDWFCWNWPKVVRRIVLGESLSVLKQDYADPIYKKNPPPEWSFIRPDGFDAVYWTFEDGPNISCNGLKLADPKYRVLSDASFDWHEDIQFRRPRIAILDSSANLPVTTQRYQLSQKIVPFSRELARDVILSFIGYALVCGPLSRAQAFSSQRRHPLQEPYVSDSFRRGLLCWCATNDAMVPLDPWLCSLLNVSSYIVCGTLDPDPDGIEWSINAQLLNQMATRHGVMAWHCFVRSRTDDSPNDLPGFMLGHLAKQGIPLLESDLDASYILVSATTDFNFSAGRNYARVRSLAERYRPDNDSLADWRPLPKPASGRNWFEIGFGSIEQLASFSRAMEVVEKRLAQKNVSRWGEREQPNVLYMAELRTRPSPLAPKSFIANVWNEALGARAIPFDPDARKGLIAKGSSHPELKRHIEAWKEMKHAGSKWVTYSERL